MQRVRFLECLYRAEDGSIVRMPFPKSEPDPYDVPADLYCPSYVVQKRLFGKTRKLYPTILILNTKGYTHDPEVEGQARDYLLSEISKEGMDVLEASGGLEGIRQAIDMGTYWMERGAEGTS